MLLHTSEIQSHLLFLENHITFLQNKLQNLKSPVKTYLKIQNRYCADSHTFVSLFFSILFLKGMHDKVLLLKVICMLDLKLQPFTVFLISILPYFFLLALLTVSTEYILLIHIISYIPLTNSIRIQVPWKEIYIYLIYSLLNTQNLKECLGLIRH